MAVRMPQVGNDSQPTNMADASVRIQDVMAGNTVDSASLVVVWNSRMLSDI